MKRTEKYNSKTLESLISEIDSNYINKIEYRMKLAAKIDAARIKMHLSKKQFAEKLSKKPSEITKWLSGTHNFTSDTLFEIQTLLGIELLNIDEKPREQKLYFSFEVTQEGLSSFFDFDFINPNESTDLLLKSSIPDTAVQGLYNLKTEARA